MPSFPHLDETVPPIQRQVPFHPLIRIKPNLMQPKLDGSIIGKIEQSFAVSFPLGIRSHRDAVDKQMVGIYFHDHNPSRLAVNVQNPNLTFFDVPPVIFCGRFWDCPEHSDVCRNVGIRAYPPHRVYIVETSSSHLRSF